MKFNPHSYQKFSIDFIIEKKKCALILDMGLGKTVSCLTAIDDLINKYIEIDKILIIAPLRVAKYTWNDEIQKWDHLKDLKISRVLGSAEQRMNALKAKADIYIINRENTKWLVDQMREYKGLRFDMLIIDESSSFKNPSSQRFKALRKVAPLFKRIVLLTGTPAPNSLMDLWPQMYLVDRGERLENTITAYRKKYFYPGRSKNHVVFDWTLKAGSEEEIYEKIADVAVSMKAKDYKETIKLPERIDNFIKIKMDEETKKTYKELERHMLIEYEDQIITAKTAGVLTGKLLQLANGSVYFEDGSYRTFHDLKLDALEEIIEDNEGKPILVFYNFKHDLERLKERFKEYNPKTIDEPKVMELWNQKKVHLLLAHPASVGHGLNLQAGGNIIVWFGLTWSLELYEQANARLYRQGQTETVIINHLILEGSVDEQVIQKLKDKKMTQDELIAFIKARIRGE